MAIFLSGIIRVAALGPLGQLQQVDMLASWLSLSTSAAEQLRRSLFWDRTAIDSALQVEIRGGSKCFERFRLRRLMSSGRSCERHCRTTDAGPLMMAAFNVPRHCWFFFSVDAVAFRTNDSGPYGYSSPWQFRDACWLYATLFGSGAGILYWSRFTFLGNQSRRVPASLLFFCSRRSLDRFQCGTFALIFSHHLIIALIAAGTVIVLVRERRLQVGRRGLRYRDVLRLPSGALKHNSVQISKRPVVARFVLLGLI